MQKAFGWQVSACLLALKFYLLVFVSIRNIWPGAVETLNTLSHHPLFDYMCCVHMLQITSTNQNSGTDLTELYRATAGSRSLMGPQTFSLWSADWQSAAPLYYSDSWTYCGLCLSWEWEQRHIQSQTIAHYDFPLLLLADLVELHRLAWREKPLDTWLCGRSIDPGVTQFKCVALRNHKALSDTVILL